MWKTQLEASSLQPLITTTMVTVLVFAFAVACDGKRSSTLSSLVPRSQALLTKANARASCRSHDSTWRTCKCATTTLVLRGCTVSRSSPVGPLT